MSIAGMERELKRIEESATFSSQGQFEQAKLWRLANWVFGVPAAALAAVAGGTGLSNIAGRSVVAGIALAAAGLGAIATTLNSSKRAEEARIAGNRYLGLRNDARRLREIGLTKGDSSVEESFKDICDREAEVNQLAPLPSKLAYLLARRNVKKGRTAFEVDE